MAELPLPLFLYNMPGLTKVQYEMDCLRRAMDLPRIVGLKDSSGNMSYFKDAVDLLKHRPDWTLLVGPEERLAETVLAGGHGGVNGGANLFPKLYVQLYQAARAGDTSRTEQLHAQVMQDQPVALSYRALLFIDHQGNQMRPGVPGDLRRLHGRAVSPVPRRGARTG